MQNLCIERYAEISIIFNQNRNLAIYYPETSFAPVTEMTDTMIKLIIKCCRTGLMNSRSIVVSTLCFRTSLVTHGNKYLRNCIPFSFSYFF